MDEHKPQEQAPEKVPARRKSGRMRGWKASIFACVICILVTALVTSLIFVGKFGGSSNYKLALKFAQVKQVVDKDYIGDADDTAISDASSSAIISAIGDKWSYYMTAEEYKAYQMYSNNEYAGIGVTIQLDDKTKGFRITAVTSDSPAAKAGLKQGDIITAIDGEDVTGKTLSDVQSTIRAKLNKTLKLTIQDSAGKSQTVTLDCTVIYTDPVTYKLMDNGVGYIQIRNFETGGGSRAVQAVDKLLDLGAKSLVFDLRDNPGGLLSELITILDHLLPQGDLFVSVDGNGKETVTQSDSVCVKVPMAVIVNGNTYSAAEFFAAALQEYDWATIVGQNTTGKGRSQTTIALPDGSAVHISSRKYLTPNRVDLSEQGGLVPDIVVAPATDMSMRSSRRPSPRCAESNRIHENFNDIRRRIMAIDSRYKMSQERLDTLKEELHYLETTREKEVAELIKEARSFGDLSENSEYDEAKTEQGKLYSRIAEITDLIENAEVVEKVEVAADVVTIGSRVRVLDVDEDVEEEYTIVGSQEANPMEGCISDDSPFGFALKGHKVGETVTVAAPVGELQFKIIAVENED